MTPLTIEKSFRRKIEESIGVDKHDVDRLLDLFNRSIKPEIAKNYLSHLKSSIEDIVNERSKSQILKALREDGAKREYIDLVSKEITNRRFRPFSILLKGLPTPTRLIATRIINGCAIIYYDERLNEKQKRVLIAHELGHVIFHNLLPQDRAREEIATLFALIAMLDKNNFYSKDVREYLYKSDEDLLADLTQLSPRCGA